MNRFKDMKPWMKAALIGVLLFVASNVISSLMMSGSPTMVKGADGYPVHTDQYDAAETVKKVLGAAAAVAFTYAVYAYVKASGAFARFLDGYKASREKSARERAEREAQRQAEVSAPPMHEQFPAPPSEVLDYPDDFEPQPEPQTQTHDMNDGW